MQKTFLKRLCIQLQHTNDPDIVGPSKYRFISSCFSIWWQIRYVRALKITKIQQEVTFKHYKCHGKVLNYIRALVPNDVKGEILENWCNICWERFGRPWKISSCKVSLVINFGRFVGKSFQWKFFLVKLHSAISNNIKNVPHHRYFH